jgi:hypothetical protein
LGAGSLAQVKASKRNVPDPWFFQFEFELKKVNISFDCGYGYAAGAYIFRFRIFFRCRQAAGLNYAGDPRAWKCLFVRDSVITEFVRSDLTVTQVENLFMSSGVVVPSTQRCRGGSDRPTDAKKNGHDHGHGHSHGHGHGNAVFILATS